MNFFKSVCRSFENYFIFHLSTPSPSILLLAGFHPTSIEKICQNVNLQMSEMLLRRGAKINHRNGGGNTALHYAMAYEPNGLLGEMLISNGADDSIENKDSLSCYDGLGGFT